MSTAERLRYKLNLLNNKGANVHLKTSNQGSNSMAMLASITSLSFSFSFYNLYMVSDSVYRSNLTFKAFFNESLKKRIGNGSSKAFYEASFKTLLLEMGNLIRESYSNVKVFGLTAILSYASYYDLIKNGQFNPLGLLVSGVAHYYRALELLKITLETSKIKNNPVPADLLSMSKNGKFMMLFGIVDSYLLLYLQYKLILTSKKRLKFLNSEDSMDQAELKNLDTLADDLIRNGSSALRNSSLFSDIELQIKKNYFFDRNLGINVYVVSMMLIPIYSFFESFANFCLYSKDVNSQTIKVCVKEYNSQLNYGFVARSFLNTGIRLNLINGTLIFLFSQQ